MAPLLPPQPRHLCTTRLPRRAWRQRLRCVQPFAIPAGPPPDNEAARAALDRIEPLDADVVLPGHGDPARESPATAAARARGVR